MDIVPTTGNIILVLVGSVTVLTILHVREKGLCISKEQLKSSIDVPDSAVIESAIR